MYLIKLAASKYGLLLPPGLKGWGRLRFHNDTQSLVTHCHEWFNLYDILVSSLLNPCKCFLQTYNWILCVSEALETIILTTIQNKNTFRMRPTAVSWANEKSLTCKHPRVAWSKLQIKTYFFKPLSYQPLCYKTVFAALLDEVKKY